MSKELSPENRIVEFQRFRKNPDLFLFTKLQEIAKNSEEMLKSALLTQKQQVEAKLGELEAFLKEMKHEVNQEMDVLAQEIKKQPISDALDAIGALKGKDGKDSEIPGPKGDKGDPGIDGKSLVGPQGEPGKSITGEKGDRGEKGDDGKDGFGIPGKDGSPDTPLEIADKLNTLKEKVDVSVLKGLEDLFKNVKIELAKEFSKMRRGGGGGGMGSVQHESKSVGVATTTVTTTYNIAGAGFAIWAYYSGQLIMRGTHYTVSGKTLTLTFTPDANTTIDIIYIRT